MDSLEDFREGAEAPFDDLWEVEAALFAGFSEDSEISTTVGAAFLEAEAAGLEGVLRDPDSGSGATGSEAYSQR